MSENIEVNIEKLVLHGFSHVDRYRIGQAFQLELTRLISEQGLSQSLSRGGELAQLNGGIINVARNSRPEVVGAQVAKSVYSRFSK